MANLQQTQLSGNDKLAPRNSGPENASYGPAQNAPKESDLYRAHNRGAARSRGRNSFRQGDRVPLDSPQPPQAPVNGINLEQQNWRGSRGSYSGPRGGRVMTVATRGAGRGRAGGGFLQPLHQHGPLENIQNANFRGGPSRSRPSNYRPLQRPKDIPPEVCLARARFLEQEAARELPGLDLSPDESAQKDSFRSALEIICQRALDEKMGEDAPPINLLPFGSTSSGFGIPGSDMDLALDTVNSSPDMLRTFEQALLEHGFGARLLARTRVPILKVCEKPFSELYTALREERKKWDEMSPEEKIAYDRPQRRDPGVKQGDPRTKKSGQEANAKEYEQTEAFATDNADKRVPSHHSSGKPGLEACKPDLPNSRKVKQPPQSLEASHTEHEKPVNIKSDLTDTNCESERAGEFNPTQSRDKQSRGSPNDQKKLSRPWYREKRLGPLDFPKDKVGIQCDINFSNPLGLHNTRLLRCYAKCDMRVRLMVIFVKAWASRRKINSAYNGTLCTYGYVLMVLHFLVNVASPPVCPNLQLTGQPLDCNGQRFPPNHQSPVEVCGGCDIRFWNNEDEISSSAIQNLITTNKQPLGVLLRDFFCYYAREGIGVPRRGFSWTKDTLSLRTNRGLLSKVEKKWTQGKSIMVEDREVKLRYLLAIEDPFELDHNVARTVTHFGLVAVRDEFRRAWDIIEASGNGLQTKEKLFAEVNDVIPPPGVMEKREREQGDQVESKADMQTDVEVREESTCPPQETWPEGLHWAQVSGFSTYA